MFKKRSIFIALLLLFFTISLFFLLNKGRMQADSFQAHTWSQSDFNGGISGEVHQINWTGDGWNKLSSLTGATFSGSNFTPIDPNANSEIISSIYYSPNGFNTFQYNILSQADHAGGIYYRLGSSPSAMSAWTVSWSAKGFEYSAPQLCDRKYLQFKLVIRTSSPFGIKTDLTEGSFPVIGYVLDTSGKALAGATVSSGSYSTIANIDSGGKGGPTYPSYFTLDLPISSGSANLTVSKLGYHSQTKTFSSFCSLPGASYNIMAFSLQPITSTKTASPTASRTTSTVTRTPTPTLPPTNANSPLTLVSLIKTNLDNRQVEVTLGNQFDLYPQEKINLVGTAPPNSKITLTILSDPIKLEIPADSNGRWSYTLSPSSLKLPLGKHTVTAFSTNPDGKKTDTVEVAKFNLKKTPTTQQGTAKTSISNYLTPVNIALAVIAILLIAYIIYRIIKNRKKIHQPTQEDKVDNVS